MTEEKLARYISDYLTCAFSLLVFKFLFNISIGIIEYFVYTIVLFLSIEGLKRL